MKVGNLVSKEVMRSGAQAYGAAVVACMEPFLVVSTTADMVWSQTKPEDWNVIGTATPEQLNTVQWNIPAEHQVRAPQGESFLSNLLGCGLTLTHLGLKPQAVDLNEKHVVHPVMRRCWPQDWLDKHTAEANPTYGWVFEYCAESNLWKARFKLEEDAQLQDVLSRARGGKVAVSMSQVEHVFEFQTYIEPTHSAVSG